VSFLRPSETDPLDRMSELFAGKVQAGLGGAARWLKLLMPPTARS